MSQASETVSKVSSMECSITLEPVHSFEFVPPISYKRNRKWVFEPKYLIILEGFKVKYFPLLSPYECCNLVFILNLELLGNRCVWGGLFSENRNHGTFPPGEHSPQEIGFENGAMEAKMDTRAFSGRQSFACAIN